MIETLLNLEDVHPAAQETLPLALSRALAAGAEPPIEYVGAGATAIVFKDSRGLAYKAGRWEGVFNMHGLSEEAEWLAAANVEPDLEPFVADVYHFDPDNAVIVREHVEGYPGGWSQESSLRDLHIRIDELMRERHGWSSPEFKGDSYIYHDGNPVLVDASSAHRLGDNLLSYVTQIVEGTRPALESPQDLGFALRSDVFDGRIARSDAVPLLEALGQSLPD